MIPITLTTILLGNIDYEGGIGALLIFTSNTEYNVKNNV